MQKTLSYYDDNARELSRRYESAKVDYIHMEIGCGSGRDAAFMFQNGYDVLAIDGSREMISEAKRYHPELAGSLQVMKIPDELYFEPSSFDGVYSIATLMHLGKDAIDCTFEKIAALLKTGGKFLFSVSIRRDDVDDEGKDVEGRYFTTLLVDEWIVCCEKYGMYVEHTEISGDGLNRDGVVWLTCIIVKMVC